MNLKKINLSQFVVTVNNIFVKKANFRLVFFLFENRDKIRIKL